MAGCPKHFAVHTGPEGDGHHQDRLYDSYNSTIAWPGAQSILLSTLGQRETGITRTGFTTPTTVLSHGRVPKAFCCPHWARGRRASPGPALRLLQQYYRMAGCPKHFAVHTGPEGDGHHQDRL